MEKLPPRVASILFHDVGDDPTASGFQDPAAAPYRHTEEDFRGYLRAIYGAPLAPCLVNQIDFAKPGRYLTLSFDDGGVSNLAAARLLEERDWRGHFFITTERIGTKGFLRKADIRGLAAAGHLVGSHSHTHPNPFFRLPAARQIEEFTTSRAILEDILGQEVTLGSIPGGEASGEVFANLARAGLTVCFTSEPSLAPFRLDGTVFLGRACPKADTPRKQVARLAAFKGWHGQQGLRLAKRAIKRLLYPLGWKPK